MAAAAITLVAPSAMAHDEIRSSDGAIDNAESTHVHHQHGGDHGHLPATSSNVRVVGKAAVNQDKEGRVADVGVHNGYAYLAAFSDPNCQKGGVYVFDIHDPTAPKQINFIRTGINSYVGEGSQVVRIDTPKFTGDILAFNNEICGTAGPSTVGGATLVDVTNPKVHKYLAEGFGDFDPVGGFGAGVAHEVHSVFVWDAGDKAYAVLVDDDEAADVDIFDITDPRTPVKVAEYDLLHDFPQIGQAAPANLTQVFHHDMVVKKIGGRQVMLVSYWDGGYVLLDVTNPAAATYLGDTDFASVDPELLESAGISAAPEGNAHQAEFTADNQYVIAADEDFNPTVLAGATDDGTSFRASTGDSTPQLGVGEQISGTAVYVGRACPGDTAVPAGGAGTQVAVVTRGACAFTEKVASVAAAGGYEAVVIANREGDCGAFGMTVAGSLPTFSVDRRTGFSLFDKEAAYDETACQAGGDTLDGSLIPGLAVGATGDVVTLTSSFDGWGYVHLYRNGTGKLAELDTYALPESHDPDHASGSGDLSVHEVATSPTRADLAYFSYYAGGFRVAKIQDDELVEVARFIDEGGNNFWGVEVFAHGGREYVAASDRDYGLYIFEYTGP
ncbi:PA domain-containing protein [Actinokineospora soli]|uniref:PA domain-containing protein n=1 Tax=Actinokineospora soli TaxID=1048753 RepID=A0ABW2TME5_9PSEU